MKAIDSQDAVPITLFKGMIYLVTSKFEDLYYKINQKEKFLTENGWSRLAKDKGFFIDLSQVRWVEIGATAQLVLLVESAKKEGINVSIALPLCKLRKSEENYLEKKKIESEKEYLEKFQLLEGLRSARESARGYLSNIQFERTVQCSHIKSGKVNLLDDYDIRDNLNDDSIVERQHAFSATQKIIKSVKKPEDIGYKFIIPLTWISGGNINFIEETIQQILSEKDRGIDLIDVLAIKNVILSELLKNVVEHSKSEYALIGAVLQPTKIISSEYFPICERDYFDWTVKVNSNYLSIYFGDTGRGLANTLKSAYRSYRGTENPSDIDIIYWAFDKWSTQKLNEEIRGTKGIYRIQRIINKYDGLITIRTGNKIAGFQKGGKEIATAVSIKTGLSHFPGTFIRMQMSPFKELAKFNINPSNSTTAKLQGNFEWKPVTINISSTNYLETFKVIEEIAKQHKGTEVLNILIYITFVADLPSNEYNIVITTILKYLCEIRHPNAIAIYGFPTGWSNIENIIDSIISGFEKEYKDTHSDQESLNSSKEDVYDPVLVLGNDRQFAWVGNDRKITAFLGELYSTDLEKSGSIPFYNKLSEIEKIRVSQYCKLDPAVTSISNENTELLFDFNNLSDYYAKKLKQKLDDFIKGNPQKGVYFVTPNLKFVRHWIELEKVLDKDITGYAFALSNGLKKAIKELPESLHDYKILIDNQETLLLAVSFAEWLGIPKEKIINLIDEIDGKLPRRNPIFNENDKVIIFTTIISTDESVRRSLKAIFRDQANPVSIVSLISQVPETTVKVWGKEVKVVSLLEGINFQITKEEIDSKGLRPLYKKPFSFNEEDEDQEKNNTEGLELLFKLIADNKALHFNHIGKSNSRHFTFYLSSGRILNNKGQLTDNEDKCKSLIYDKFQERIVSWMTNINSRSVKGKRNSKLNEDGIQFANFEIWRPTPDFKLEHPVNKIIEKITSSLETSEVKIKCIKVHEIKRNRILEKLTYVNDSIDPIETSNNVVIIDWGSITGGTIQQLISLAVSSGKENILVCTLFSQLPKNEEKFITSIRQVRGYKTIRSEKMFDPVSYKEVTSEIEVDFLYRLPLKYYESIDCWRSQ